jgi:hypothetical protein
MVTLVEELRSQHREVLAAVGTVEATQHALLDRIQGVEVSLGKRISEVEVRLVREIGNVKADLMKWSFLFWVGAVTAIALLAGVLGR